MAELRRGEKQEEERLDGGEVRKETRKMERRVICDGRADICLSTRIRTGYQVRGTVHGSGSTGATKLQLRSQPLQDPWQGRDIDTCKDGNFTGRNPVVPSLHQEHKSSMAHSCPPAPVPLSSSPAETTACEPWIADNERPLQPLPPLPPLPPLSPLRSNPVVLRRRSAPMARPVPCSSSGSRALVDSSHRHSISSIYGNGSVGELLGSGRCIEDEIQEMREMRKMVQARRGREDFTSLIEFLKNHEPPPGNFMSIPYASPGSKSFKDLGGKWLKLKHVGQRQRATAKVPKPLILPDSAVSGMTIGGHRHIAISIPLEAMPFADAAAVQSNHVSAAKGTMPRAPTKNSAVRTFVDEEGVVTVLRATGGDASPSGSALTCRPQAPYQHHRRRSSQSLVLTYLDQKANAPRRSHEKCSSQSTADTYLWRDPVPEGGGERSSARELQRSSCYPARRSSVSTGWGNSRTITIDGVVSLYAEDHRIASGVIPRLYDVKPLPRTPANREKGIASKPSSRQPSPIGEESPGQELAAAQETMTRPTSQASMASRRERVRTRKRRDMEALRKLSMGKGGHVSEDEGSGSPEKTATRSQSQLALCPIQVVVDLEPVPASVQGTMGSGSSSGSSADGEWDEPLTPLTPLSGSPVRNGKKPRQSLPGSSQQQQEQQQEHGKEAQTDNQMLRLCDVFREDRMRDAERRIRRLERNGDVWLRALIPLLDDMHKSIKAAQGRSSVDEDGDEGRDMASEEGIGASRAEKRTVAATRKRSSSRERTAGTSKQEEGGGKGLVREDGEGGEGKSESKSASASTDASGMGAIEPLMRELAGEARRRQRVVVREYYNG